MELRAIEAFLKVADLGSFSEAARRLGYSQPAVTMQVKQLEEELGVRLFDRTPRRALLTEQGIAFSVHAHEIHDAVQKARVAAHRSSAPDADLTGTLRIGSVESIATALLPEMLVRFTQRHPHVEVVVQTMRGDLLADLARSGGIDLFFTLEKKLAMPGFTRLLLHEEEIVFVGPPGITAARSAQRGMEAPEAEGCVDLSAPLSPEELGRMPFVLTERGESYRQELDRAMAEHDCAITPVVEAGNTETLVHLAERGIGCAFLPRFSIEGALQTGSLAHIDTTLPAIRIWSQLFHHEKKWVTPAMHAFIDVARAYFQERETAR